MSREPTGFAFSTAWLVSGASALLITAVVLTVGVVTEGNLRNMLTEERVGRLSLQANHLALMSTSALLTPYPELTLHPLVRAVRMRQPELTLAVVTNSAQVIQGDSQPERIGLRFTPPAVTRLRAVADAPNVQIGTTSELLLAEATIAHPNGTVLGSVYLGLSRRDLDESIERARRPLWILFGVFLVAGIVGSLLLTRHLLRPIGVLRTGLERIGNGDLDTHLTVGRRTEFARLAATVNRMTADLKRAQFAALERQRLVHEMGLAHHIQRSLLPAPHVIEGSFVVHGEQRSAAEVGGDFYDVFRVPDGRLGVLIADVSGKGLSGCLVASMLAASVAAVRESCGGPAALLAAIDRALVQRLEPGAFITVFVGFLDCKTGSFTYCSAGHHPALVTRATGEIEWLKGNGLPIGAERKHGIASSLSESTVVLGEGDMLLQTTDGVHEAERDTDHEQFGFERLGREVSAEAKRGPSAVLGALKSALHGWRGGDVPADDETVVLVHRMSTVRTSDPFADAMALVLEARSHGQRLKLPATADALVRLEDWLERIQAVPEAERDRVRLVLHELCANIVEHGLETSSGVAADSEKVTTSIRPTIELWWMPPSVRDLRDSSSAQTSDARSPCALGHCVIIDQGRPFSADNISAPDLGDAKVRRRGRGLGLDLVRRASSHFSVHSGTPVGNVTVVGFGAVTIAKAA